MSKEPELMVACTAFVDNELSVRKGLQLPSDHPIVKKQPKFFVSVALGEEAALTRASEIEHASERLREDQRARERAARIAMGTKFDASDDSVSETSKRRARSDDSLELVHDANGFVIGVRTKPAILEAARQRAEKTALVGDSESTQRIAELQRAREA